MKNITKEAKTFKAKCTNNLCACEFEFIHGDLDSVYTSGKRTEYVVTCPCCGAKIKTAALEEVKAEEATDESK